MRKGLLFSSVLWLFIFTQEAHASARTDITPHHYTIGASKLDIVAHVPTEYTLEGETEEVSLTNTDSMVQQQQKYYTLGGVRLKISVPQNLLSPKQLTALEDMEWTIDAPGKLCTDFTYTKDGSECDAIDADTVFNESHEKLEDNYSFYWEPEKWDNNLKAQGKLTITFNNEDFPTKEILFKLEKRTLRPASSVAGPVPADTQEGDDVAMLESMLWHLGVSPSDNPGVSGVRLLESQRNTFSEGVASVGLMLGRFNYFSHSPIADITDHQEMLSVGIDSTVELKNHWLHYMYAYQSRPLARFAFEHLTPEDIAAAEAVFDGKINYPNGADLGTIDATYTSQLHEKVKQYKDFKRSDILKAMAKQESNSEHSGYQNKPDNQGRITVGGADEAGSSGFNQIQNKYTYGGLALDGTSSKTSSICAPASAYNEQGESQVNHYDPGQNLTAKAVWLVGEQGNCGRSFRKAFHDQTYNGIYSSAGSVTLLRMKTGSTPYEVQGGTHTDDTYETLNKAIGAYNQGAGVFSGGDGNSWLSLLSRQNAQQSSAYKKLKKKGYGNLTKTEKIDYGRTTAMVYAMKVMHDSDKLGLPNRTYIFEGGTYPEGDPKAGTKWCFAYGEEEWVAGKEFSKVEEAARGDLLADPPIQPQGRINCTTGDAI
ncbi:hypothetical protein [Bermanella sp. R86510]|uniref:hypothetical protein n=1 Tax=unclassified Bermanella TaxID=2627862 RepID=UPI0037CB8504